MSSPLDGWDADEREALREVQADLEALRARHQNQPPLARSPASERRGRLTEAVRQARAAAGRDAVLQVVEIDPGSRVPERRTLLTPFPERKS